ncbi:efflux transporter, RND family, MFP subunit [Thioalkalivibrio sulfidiphilus HL-EbGr7]|uniref:Efflux transporter, RND family, MFP subunit n=1 Tax=Thioalkalivibrio sulfidiphilus (strain HL-EbGR7) TaxID=396588 RepID=B8GMG3_THISH|nr:efflux RND transporter periplasmic adaptor subunit [Thioalkalivibrio sulfidiphilus]ACL71795.1 efflux transporter, RND family, MFP subunit [Thioalkalivibrio sulfidiphilus HL-EbGr7]
MKKLVAPLVLVLAAIIAVGAVYHFQQQASAPQASAGGGGGAPIPVVVAEVGLATYVTTLESLGTARSNESVDLAAKVTGRVEALNFSDGQRVRRGDLLAQLDTAEQRADLQEAEVRLAEQRREVDRIRGLVADRALPRQRLDEQESRLSEAQARLEAARARLDDRSVHAPFGGVLGLRRVSVGALVNPGTLITTLDDVSVIKLDFTVPETFLPGIEVGQNITARSAAYPGREFRGRVTSVDSRVDPGTRAGIVRAEIPNPDSVLFPGMLLTVRLLKQETESLSIPEAALVPMRDEQYVFVVNDDERVERLRIVTGRRAPGRVEVLEGLEQGIRVVVQGTNRVRPGIRVEAEVSAQ